MAKTRKGIDVSRWQGNVDFNKVKAAGYEFVMLNAGYGRYISQKDPYFEQNYKNAKAAGLGVGAYWYSYAMNAVEAKKEAEVFLQAISNKQFDYPLAFDIEENKQSNLSMSVLADIVNAFCGCLENKGYYVSLYSYASFLSSKIPASCRARYDIWVAAFDVQKPQYDVYGMWQYTSRGKVNGITGNVDLNYAYKDYPTIIKEAGLNGYSKPKAEDKNKSETELKPAPASTEPVKGDLNGDGKVDVTDLNMLTAHVKGIKPIK